MKINIKQLSILLVIFLVIFITACDGLTSIDFEQEDQVKRVLSSDSQSSILVPKIWSDDHVLNEQAEINVEAPLKEQYAIVLTESADIFTEDMTLDDYFELVSESMKESVINTAFTEPERIEIDNKPALLFQIHGEVDKIKVSYLIAIVEGESNYYQIITWTLQEKFEDYKDLYMDIINSFKTHEENVSTNKNNSTPNEGEKTYKKIVSTDGKVQLTATEEWQEPEELLHIDSNISIINVSKDMYTIVIPDPKEYFTDDMTLNDYYTIIFNNMSSSFTNPTATDPLDNVIENYNSIQFELSGEISKIKLRYLVTIVETEDSFYQIIEWTSHSTFQKYKEELSSIASSFKVLK